MEENLSDMIPFPLKIQNVYKKAYLSSNTSRIEKKFICLNYNKRILSRFDKNLHY